MSDRIADLRVALENGPAFLLLGQGYLGLEKGIDPFLADVCSKFGPDNGDTYNALLEGRAGEAPDNAVAWMDALSNRLRVPAWLSTVASFPWSGVYTSAIDSVWKRAFRVDWRELQSIYNDKLDPTGARSRSLLHCTSLFGCVSQDDPTERPPLTTLELRKRKRVAQTLLDRLPRLVTPKGILIIEGCSGNGDWLTTGDLMLTLYDFNPGQVHLFSPTAEIESHSDVKRLQESGQLTIHPVSLAQFLQRESEAGFIALGNPNKDSGTGHVLNLKAGPIPVPIQLWNQTARSATILDRLTIPDRESLSKNRRYAEFRRFLGESSVRPLWGAYANGLNFTRSFERTLRGVVDTLLSSKEVLDLPVILHGQAGTGKTVALGNLAYQVTISGKFPVLFIERKTQRPNWFDIDAFCKHCEDHGALANLVIWDGMFEPEQYFSFLRGLTSRGRKVVLVGSSYRQQDDERSSEYWVPAPSVFDQEESSTFVEFLNGIEPTLGDAVKTYGWNNDPSYLVALYRLLPDTRSQLRTGLVEEFNLAQRALDALVSRPIEQDAYETTLGRLLRAALVSKWPALIPNSPVLVSENALTDSELLTALILVPGRLGLRVPLDLLLRAMGPTGYKRFPTLFAEFDIFRWHQDEDGNVFVSPRHPVEAEQIARARYGNSIAESEFIHKLLVEVKSDLDIGFTVELMRQVRSERHYKYFAEHFGQFAQALCHVRLERGILSERLMLQEGNVWREWAQYTDKNDPTCNPRVLEALESAEEVLRLGISSFDQRAQKNPLRAGFLVELASTLGAKQYHLLVKRNLEITSSTLLAVFREIKQLFNEARAIDSVPYKAVDVLAWTTRDLFVQAPHLLTPAERAEAEADIRFAFDTIQEDDLVGEQLEEFQRRRQQLADVLGDKEMDEESFQALCQLGSCAGYYVRAARIVRGMGKPEFPLNNDQRGTYDEAARYLETYRKTIRNDERCLHLLLQYWWLAQAGVRMFNEERQTVKLTEREWVYLRGILEDLQACGALALSPRLKYLYGLACFQTKKVSESFGAFDELDRDTPHFGRRRIIRSYLLSDSDGKPVSFNGTVLWSSAEDNKGEVYVQGLRRNVPLRPLEFNLRQGEKNVELNGFYLAFNFLGPIADNPVYYHRARR